MALERAANQRAAAVWPNAHHSDLRGAVVISRNGNDGQFAVFSHALDEPGETSERALWRNGAVEDVAGDDQEVRLTLLNDVDNLIEDEVMIFVERDCVELPAQMPVACMKDTHQVPHSTD